MEHPEGDEEYPGDWEPDRLLEMAGHDLLNQQQAALGFLEMLEDSPGLSEPDRALVDRTVEALEQTGRLLLQLRTALVQRTVGEVSPSSIDLASAVKAAARATGGAFTRDRLSVDVRGVENPQGVRADHMLPEVLTQLLVLLAEPSPQGRRGTVVVSVEPVGETVEVKFMSEGFALNPMVLDALVRGRGPPGRGRDTISVGLVRHHLFQYGAVTRMEEAPPGGVGAHLVIVFKKGGEVDALDHDSR